MKTPKTPSDRKTNSIRDLIRECDRLMQPDTYFSNEELAQLQYDAIHCLLRLGPNFDAIREKVEDLRFSPNTEPIWNLARTGEQVHIVIPFSWDEAQRDEHIAGCLKQLKDLLVAASARQKAITPSAQRGDPDNKNRWRAIHAACNKHKGKPKYIEKVCLDLHNSGVPMPKRWLDAWAKLGIRFEPSDWVTAYEDPIAKSKLVKYISKRCERTSRPG